VNTHQDADNANNKQTSDEGMKDLRDVYLAKHAQGLVHLIESAQTTTFPPEQDPSVNESDAEITKIQVPGDGQTLGKFCAEMAPVLKTAGFFARDTSIVVPGSVVGITAESRLVEVTANMLRAMSDDFAHLIRKKKSKDGDIEVRVSLDSDTSRVVIEAPQVLSALPRIDFLHPAPLPWIAPTGELGLLTEGYNAQIKALVENRVRFRTDLPFPLAKGMLESLLCDFQFLDARSRAAAIAAILTPICRHLLPEGSLMPGIVIDAQAAGSGKSTLAELIGLLYGKVGVQSAPSREDDWPKVLVTQVRMGKPVIIFDNIDRHLESEALAMYLSSNYYSGRLLLQNREITGRSSAVVVFTGNNMTFNRDLARRLIVVELHCETLRAEDRRFSRQLDSAVLEKYRSNLLACAWSLVKAWDKAGRPRCSSTNASFPAWCERIGGIVEHAGFGDPAQRPQRDDRGDVDTANFERLAANMLPDHQHAFGDIMTICATQGLFGRFIDDVDDRGDLTKSANSAFGKLLKSFGGRIIPGLGRFVVTGESRKRRYCIQETTIQSTEN
jgi:hypothetical protein